MLKSSPNNVSASSHAPDDNEILLSSENADILASESTNISELSNSDIIITDHQSSQSMSNPCRPTTHRNDLIGQLKDRLKPQKNEPNNRDERNPERNDGFLLVDQDKPELELVFIPNENMDQELTQHAEPCVHGQLGDDPVDANQSQNTSMSPTTPSLLPPLPQSTTFASLILPVVNYSQFELDIQATQAGVECAAHDTQHSLADSASSTSSSNTEEQLTNTDQSTLDDTNYVRSQKHDLERITIYEIALINDRQDYSEDSEDSEVFDLNRVYNDAREQNARLNEELTRLHEDSVRIYSSWACEVCTLVNEPYIKTRRDVCEACEGPSPLKRHTLTS